MTLEKEGKPFNLKIARILMFVCAIAIIIVLFYLYSINIIPYNAYLLSGFAIVIATAIINFVLIRRYGRRPTSRTA